jgi:cyclopropane fatty-acyl-phospholipid synthase-like methyltransferase
LEGKGELIFQSIVSHLPSLKTRGKVVLDIGSGCGQLSHLMINYCRELGHTLLLVDSEEMLTQLPSEGFTRKFPAYYPQCESLFRDCISKVDIILAYSVLHYVFVEGNVWDFLDRSLELLAEGGEMLIGDIPNISKRRRFFSSANGIKFHREFMKTLSLPEVHFNRVERHKIDDAVILGLVARARNQGFDAYVVPQATELPMANRREDVVIRRP